MGNKSLNCCVVIITITDDESSSVAAAVTLSKEVPRPTHTWRKRNRLCRHAPSSCHFGYLTGDGVTFTQNSAGSKKGIVIVQNLAMDG